MKIDGWKNVKDLQAKCLHDAAHRDDTGAEVSIFCDSCRMRWFPGDTAESLVCKFGSQRNHTGLSWQNISMMLERQQSADLLVQSAYVN